MTTPPRSITCQRCNRNTDRSRLLLLSADALEAAANMERLIFQLIEGRPAESAARLMALESMQQWQHASEALNRALRADARTREIA